VNIERDARLNPRCGDEIACGHYSYKVTHVVPPDWDGSADETSIVHLDTLLTRERAYCGSSAVKLGEFKVLVRSGRVIVKTLEAVRAGGAA
jgi:hypothetical protein